MNLYAMDPIRETSAEVLINPIVELWSSGPCGRREVLPLGGTAWGDDKNLSHIFVTRISREKLCYSETN
jgi:hypothetical protein